MGTITYTGVLYTTECPTCNIPHGIPMERKERMLERGGSVTCPNGHSWHFTDSSFEDKLKRARAKERHLTDQLEAAERSAAAHKGHVTRVKNRVKAGVCPFCNRSFQNVKRHMESKHAEEHV